MKSFILGLTITGILAADAAADARDLCVDALPPVPRDTSFTVWSTQRKIARKHPEATILPATLPEGVRIERDMVYTTIPGTPYGDRELHADVVRPDNDSIYPALLMIHGGGWSSGDKSLQLPMAMQIAAHGYVIIPVEYRLTPEAPYPAGLHDVKTAVRWARANAEQLGIDPDRIAISGCSAGAQLATLVGVTNGLASHEGDAGWVDASSEVQAVINMDGIATFTSPYNIVDAYERLEKKGEKPVNAQWLGGMYHEARTNWDHATALNWITPSSAPICFISSGLPRYSDGRDALVTLYTALGIPAERHAIDVDIHPFWFFHPWVDEALAHAISFLDKTFKSPQASPQAP